MASLRTTNLELDKLGSKLKIPNYVPCRIKDKFRSKIVSKREDGIVNLQNLDQAGSPWVMYLKGETTGIEKI